ncbi:fatty acid amide hydrolase-like, partial [Trifolium medium]|nr:fatty acid amide hydrolase-like [Trifolium medium]
TTVHKEQEVKCLDFDFIVQNFALNEYAFANSFDLRRLSIQQVAERFIAADDESSKPRLQMGFFINYSVEDILRQANESTIRYQKGESISVLDGVPVAIKDEIDCLPYPTTGGPKWLHKQRPCTDDAYCIK